MGGRGSASKRTGYTRPMPKAEPAPAAEPERKAGPDLVDEPEIGEDPRYHYFYDKAVVGDGFNYEGDGHHQEEWFKANSNLNEVLDAVDKDTKSAMWDWTGGHFMAGQQYDGWDRMSAGDKMRTQRYDDMLDKSVLKKGVTVVRRTTPELLLGKGVTRASLADLQALEGSTISSRTHLSTGAAAEGLTIGSLNKRQELKIHIPAGSKGAGMWIGDKRVNPGWVAKQHEFMMNRDIMLKVGKTRYDKKRDVYVTEVTYVGRTAHDYGKSGRL